MSTVSTFYECVATSYFTMVLGKSEGKKTHTTVTELAQQNDQVAASPRSKHAHHTKE